MEYVSHGSLSSVMENNVFSPYMRCRFMVDVARGMEYLHSQGVIHRDLKPGNVLVSSVDPNAEVLCKISDFGESRKGLADTQTMTMTRGIGTPYYMAEEMLRGDNKYTRAVDVYSYGIMGAELWNERMPYIEKDFETPYAFMQYVMSGGRPEIREDCPQALAKLFVRCWASDKQERPSFTSIVKDLNQIVDDINKSLPATTEHVRARENGSKKSANSGSQKTNSIISTKNTGGNSMKRERGGIEMDEFRV